jgi:hypothetical protein
MSSEERGYWSRTKYIGADGTQLELKFNGRPGAGRQRSDAWLFRIGESEDWCVGGATKFDAIVAASSFLGKSAEDLRWEPLEPGPRPDPNARPGLVDSAWGY